MQGLGIRRDALAGLHPLARRGSAASNRIRAAARQCCFQPGERYVAAVAERPRISALARMADGEVGYARRLVVVPSGRLSAAESTCSVMPFGAVARRLVDPGSSLLSGRVAAIPFVSVGPRTGSRFMAELGRGGGCLHRPEVASRGLRAGWVWMGFSAGRAVLAGHALVHVAQCLGAGVDVGGGGRRRRCRVRADGGGEVAAGGDERGGGDDGAGGADAPLADGAGAGRLEAIGWLVMVCLLLGVGRSACQPPSRRVLAGRLRDGNSRFQSCRGRCNVALRD